MNCISTTGRIPMWAAPAAAPVKPASLMGVSMTRLSPKCARKPSVTLNAPPYAPMSSPRRKTAGSRSISSHSASRIASSIVTGLPSSVLRTCSGRSFGSVSLLLPLPAQASCGFGVSAGSTGALAHGAAYTSASASSGAASARPPPPTRPRPPPVATRSSIRPARTPRSASPPRGPSRRSGPPGRGIPTPPARRAARTAARRARRDPSGGM
jgi:hypothetical protein